MRELTPYTLQLNKVPSFPRSKGDVFHGSMLTRAVASFIGDGDGTGFILLYGCKWLGILASHEATAWGTFVYEAGGLGAF